MTISPGTKSTIKQAMISILIGASVAFATAILEGVLNFVKANWMDISGSGAAMIYYLKSKRYV